MKICERCKKNLAREGISLCDICYKKHNEIYRVSTSVEKKLPESPKSDRGLKTVYTILCILGSMVFVASVYIFLTLNQNPSSEPRPVSGTVFEGGDMIAFYDNVNFSITGYSNYDCVIKLHNTILDKSIVFYLRNERDSTKSIPIGYYRMKAACGSDWMNPFQFFGQNTVFYQTVNVLDMFSDFRMILEPEEPGTIPIEIIRASDF